MKGDIGFPIPPMPMPVPAPYFGDDDHAFAGVDRGGLTQIKVGESGDKAKLDAGKLRYSLIPSLGLRELANVYTIGAAKYSPHGWAEGMSWSRIQDAMERHWEAWCSGETHDPVDGQHHLSAVAWCAFTLMEYEADPARYGQYDDRLHGADWKGVDVVRPASF